MKAKTLSFPDTPKDDTYRRTLSGLYLPESQAEAPLIVQPPRPKILIPESAVIAAYERATEAAAEPETPDLQLDSLSEGSLIIR